MTQLPNSHKGWKGKVIKLKSPGGFGVSLEWRLTDNSQNKLSKVMEVEAIVFTKIRRLSFSRELVKNEAVVGKH